MFLIEPNRSLAGEASRHALSFPVISVPALEPATFSSFASKFSGKKSVEERSRLVGQRGQQQLVRVLPLVSGGYFFLLPGVESTYSAKI